MRPTRTPNGLKHLLLIAVLGLVTFTGEEAARAATVNGFTGTFDTSVPIAVPPYHGLQPKLELGYSSRSGNGFVGVGWSLSGMSVISLNSKGRGAPRFDGQDLYYLDSNELIANTFFGGTHSPRIQSYDRIKYDGITDSWTVTQRDGIKRTYGKTAASRMMVRSGGATGPIRVARWYLDSVIDTKGNTVSYEYWTDDTPTGCATGSGELYLNRVSYNNDLFEVVLYRESRQDPIVSATGGYCLTYLRYRLKSIAVRVKSGGSWQLVRAYQVTYDPAANAGDPPRSLVASIQQFGSDANVNPTTGVVTGGLALPPMTLKYTSTANDGTFPAPARVTIGELPELPSDRNKVIETVWKKSYADVDGDGRADVFFHGVGTTTVENAQGACAALYVARATGGASFALPQKVWADCHQWYWNSRHPLRGRWQWTIADVNGDGRADAILNYIGVGYWHGYQLKVFLANGAGTFKPPVDTKVKSASFDGWSLSFGDFNRDGLTDAIAYEVGLDYGMLTTKVALSNGDGTFGDFISTPIAPAGYGPGWSLGLGDVNGDGASDAIAVGPQDTSVKVALARGDGTFGPLGPPVSRVGTRWHLADVNGDGMVDVVFTGSTPTSITVALSRGDGTLALGAATDFSGLGYTYREWEFVDVNGDGTTDAALSARNSPEGAWKLHVILARPDGTFSSPLAGTIQSSPTYTKVTWGFADFDGDGKADAVLNDGAAPLTADMNNSYWLLPMENFMALGSRPPATTDPPAPSSQSNLLSQLQNGLGATTTISYVTSTDACPAGAAVACNNQLPLGAVFPIVSAVSMSGSSTAITSYTYDAARWNVRAREFLGFRKVTSTDNSTGGYSETYYWQREGSIAKPEVIYTRDKDGKIFSYHKYVYQEDQERAPFKSLLREMWIYDCNGDAVFEQNGADATSKYLSGCRRVVTTYEWDEYGNVTRELQHGDIDRFGDERTYYREFLNRNDVNGYLVAFPAWEKIYAGLLGLTPSQSSPATLMAWTSFYYDGAAQTAPTVSSLPTAGLLTRKCNRLTPIDWQTAGERWLCHNFEFDQWGNETAYIDPLGRRASKTYDTTYNLYQKTSSNTKMHTTTTEYDYVLGVATSTTDPNGQTSTTTYDKLGRPELSTQPDGGKTKLSYLDYGDSANQRNRQCLWLPDAAMWVCEDHYFDGFERTTTVKEGLENPASGVFTSTGTIATTQYNGPGQVEKQCKPKKDTDPNNVCTSNAYDPLGRLIKSTSPDNVYTVTQYDDDSVTIKVYLNEAAYVNDVAPLSQGTVWKNVFGASTAVREHEGGTTRDTSFTYDVLGRRLSATDSLGNVTLATYDSLGRVLEKSDPDQGVWRYTYYDDGQIKTEIDARGRTTTVDRDELGRVYRRLYPDGKADTYAFDELNHGSANGRVTSSLSAQGVGVSVSYDSMGRRTAFTQTVKGEAKTIAHAYDNAGRITSISYPDGETVSYTYGTVWGGSDNNFGRLKAVSGSVAGALVTNMVYKTTGELDQLHHGNGVVTSYQHDSTSGQTTRIAIGSLATLDYQYDVMGRVKQVSSVALPLTNWTYAYDELGRLRSATNNGGGASQSFTYDPIGRIASRTIGAQPPTPYLYGDEHVHAVVKAGADRYGYDANGAVLSGKDRLFEYDGDHRPLSITTMQGGSPSSMVKFTYDAHGARVLKQSRSVGTGGTDRTVRYVGSLLEIVRDATGCRDVKHYFAGSQRIAVADPSQGGLAFVHQDLLGSTVLVSGGEAANRGQKLQSYEYGPFGEVLAGSNGQTHTFTGQEVDAETGLMFFHARIYDPTLGRFLQPDSFLPDPEQPQAFDLYSYVSNSPTNAVDPSGHLELVVAVAAKIGTIAIEMVAFAVNHPVATAMMAVGTGLSMSSNPTLQSIGMVMAGIGGSYMFAPLPGSSWLAGKIGLGLSAQTVSAAISGTVAALQSPISPLDPTVKKVIGWAYNAYAFAGALNERMLDAQFEAARTLRPSEVGSKWSYLGDALWGSVKSEVKMFASFAGVSNVSSKLKSPALSFTLMFIGKGVLVSGRAVRTSGPLSFLGSTFDLAYTLTYPDGRTYDLRDGGAGREEITFWYHSGFEPAGQAMGRQHITVEDGGGYWQLDNVKGVAGFWRSMNWQGWVSTQKVTVVMNSNQAAAFRGALAKAASMGGSYVMHKSDSNTFVSAALEFATGRSAAALHINPGLPAFLMGNEKW